MYILDLQAGFVPWHTFVSPESFMSSHYTQSWPGRKLERLRYLYRHGGVSGVLFHLLYRTVNRFTRLRIFRAAILEASAPIGAQLARLGPYRHGMFTPEELKRFTDNPENDLTPDFLDYAAAQGDTCYAVLDGDELVSYCWNSDKPTAIEDDLRMEFRNGYIYRYKEFTRPSYRGRRLSTYARAEALCSVADSGVQGYAGYVEIDNFVCYRALERAGHRFPGFIVIFGKGPTPWIWHSQQAKDWGFRVVSTAAPPLSSGGRQVHLAQPGAKKELGI